ncbi:phage integrase [Skermanella aerolata]|uniref:Phage integrase n=1 Tax=Skermanella aerolata TaxID=393310 RepID=A0A512E203_9PROT|nr:site-specific integrase [Skermanella aerolata]GEO42759.1 phage integrase [Skermanella aerolata]
MARKIGQLTALAVTRLTKPGLYADGGGLYLRVGPSGAKSWVFRFRVDGKRRDMGLGPVHAVTLAGAREKATSCRTERFDGRDPLAGRQARNLAAKLEASKAMTFCQCAAAYIDAHRLGWKNEKHAAQWASTLETYANPVFGDLPVQAVNTALVMKALEPIWRTKTETASRVRGRIEAVLDWATVRDFRQGDNPARWRGHLDHLLPLRAKVQKVQHHPALPYAEIGTFMTSLRSQEGHAARALEFLILTAGRTGEVIGARWGEISLAEGIWTVPASRMKAGREHRIPLSAPVIKLLRDQQAAAEMVEGRPGGFVFPGGNPGKGLSNMALLKVLERMKRDDLTAHGFRSTFRDWAAEQTHFPRDVAEMALAHSISDKVEAAYRRGDLFEKRRLLMEAWATYCGTVPMRKGEGVSLNHDRAG